MLFKILSFFTISLFLCACSDDFSKSYLNAENKSYAVNYEDVISNIFVSDGATNDNFVSVWNGKLKSGQSVKFDIENGKYGVKFMGTRYYSSGIEKPLEFTTGYKSPVRFASGWTVLVTYDGEGIVAEEYAE